jgi:hypothetical protein
LKSSLIQAFGTTEDVPYGFLAQATIGFGDEEYEYRPYLGFEAGVARHIERAGYFTTTVEVGGLIDNGRFEEGAVNVVTFFFTNLTAAGEYKFRHMSRLLYTIGIRRLPFETINLDGKIRGLSSADAEGNSNLILNWESIAFTPWDLYRFRFAVFWYTDLGFLSPRDEKLLSRDSFYGTIGIGCRIRNESLVFGTLNLEVGYLLRVPDDKDRWYFDTGTTNEEIFGTIDISRPDVVPFE